MNYQAQSDQQIFFVLMFVQLLYQFGRTCVLWHRMFKSNKFVGLTTAISLFIHHTPPFISPNFNFNQTLITKLYESKISKLYNHKVGLILNQAQLTASIQYKISLIRYPENRKDQFFSGFMRTFQILGIFIIDRFLSSLPSLSSFYPYSMVFILGSITCSIEYSFSLCFKNKKVNIQKCPIKCEQKRIIAYNTLFCISNLYKCI